MKIREIIQPKTTSVIAPSMAQLTVPQDVVAEECISAIAEGIGQILRRVGNKLKSGFRCVSGPRKGRIVAKSSTCNAKLNPVKGAKIRRRRQAKATQAGVKMAFTKRTNPASKRLGKSQVGGKQSKSGKMQRSKIIRPKK